MQGGIFFLHWPSGQTVGKLPKGGQGVFFSPDGRWLATTVSAESSALIWDVARLVNQPLPTVARPSEEELRRWWTASRQDNPGEAYKAVWQFVAVPEQTLAFLGKSLQPIKPVDSAKVSRLIDDLDSSVFQVRESATKELALLGEAVAGPLRKAKKDSNSVEQKRRLEQLLSRVAGPVPSPEVLRSIRAVAILEQIGGSEAQKILTRLAAGAAEARLTREAKDGLMRLQSATK
jgi:hypothetical protein